MAFGLKRMKTYGIKAYQFDTDTLWQGVELDITGTSSDVALDIGDSGGTFWTDVSESEPQGIFQDVLDRIDGLISLSVPELYTLLLAESGATLASGEYKITDPTTTDFSIDINATEGLTSYRVRLVYNLKADFNPVNYEFNS